MKLMQLNAWGGRLEPQIGDLLKVENPEILCLQEAISFSAEGSGLFITLETIQEEHNFPYMAFEPVFSFSYMHGTAKFGNAILSRYPIQKTTAIFTHMEHQDNYAWSKHDVANMRNFIHAVIESPGEKPLHVITHHGYWIPDHKNGSDETMQQMDLLHEYLSKLEGPIILTGDFNLAPNSTSLEKLNKSFINLSIKHKLSTTRTDLTFKTETCDYIFINDHVKEQSFKALDKIVSDHKALELEFST